MKEKLRALFPHGYIPITAHETKEELNIAFLALDDFPKFRSLAAFRSTKLATSDGILIFQITKEGQQVIEDFINRRSLKRILIRSELPGGKMGSPSLQGVPVENAWMILEDMLNKDPRIILAVQASGNIFRNLYNLNLEISSRFLGRYCIEVSGPGFTASDLNRYGFLHERIFLHSYLLNIVEPLVFRDYIISHDSYQIHRKIKIEQWGLRMLEMERALVLEYLEYPPVPVDILRELWTDRFAILQAIEGLGYSNSGAMVSLSFLTETTNRLQRCYWDIYPTN